jgi:hypothetical protein
MMIYELPTAHIIAADGKKVSYKMSNYYQFEPATNQYVVGREVVMPIYTSGIHGPLLVLRFAQRHPKSPSKSANKMLANISNICHKCAHDDLGLRGRTVARIGWVFMAGSSARLCVSVLSS